MRAKSIYQAAMTRALRRAHEAAQAGDVPVGAVVLDSEGNVIGEGWNRREVANDPTAHAEIEALRKAGEVLGTWNLSGCTLVVTLEPCTMCAGAVVNSRVDRLVFGAWDEKAGACGSIRDVVRDSRLNHEVEVIAGVSGDEAAAQLSGFFISKRNRDNAGFTRAGGAREGDVAPKHAAPSQFATRFVQPEHDVPGEELSVPQSAGEQLWAEQGPDNDSQPEDIPLRRADRHRGKPKVPPLRLPK